MADPHLIRISVKYEISRGLEHATVIITPHIHESITKDATIEVLQLNLGSSKHLIPGAGESSSHYNRNEIIFVLVQKNIKKYCD